MCCDDGDVGDDDGDDDSGDDDGNGDDGGDDDYCNDYDDDGASSFVCISDSLLLPANSSLPKHLIITTIFITTR